MCQIVDGNFQFGVGENGKKTAVGLWIKVVGGSLKEVGID
jgi:hypothetical protein